MQLTDVKTLGKELFAIFEKDVCLRVHFLMSGCVRYNNEPKELSDDNGEEPRLKLHMSEDEVGFFGSAVDIRSAVECLKKHDTLMDLDICSPTFDAKRATLTILEHPERLICDVILDQLVLPGVGNIIKNEALYDAGINPNSKVKQLNQELVSHLVKMNRDFTNIFYKCRKEGKDLRKSMRVYKKENCPECLTKITKCKVGEQARLTFFCRSCQTNTIRTVKKFAKRNSLLGWVDTVRNQVPWNCSACTLENKPANTKCVVCLTPKDSQPNARTASSTATQGVPDVVQHLQNVSTASLGISGPHSPVCFSPPSTSLIRNTMPFSSNSGDKRGLESTPEGSCRISKYKFKRISNISSEAGSPSQLQHYQLVSPKPRQNCSVVSPTSRLGTQDTSPTMSEQRRRMFGYNKSADECSMKVEEKVVWSGRKRPSKKTDENVVCSGHKKPATKSVVEKNNENRGRVFYICSMPSFKQCKFFMWADDHHPFCCHGKISVVRTVLKQNANNGREFYCCPLPKPKQCDFFEWANAKKC